VSAEGTLEDRALGAGNLVDRDIGDGDLVDRAIGAGAFDERCGEADGMSGVDGGRGTAVILGTGA
jgi:hypothetical protein